MVYANFQKSFDAILMQKQKLKYVFKDDSIKFKIRFYTDIWDDLKYPNPMSSLIICKLF